MNINLDKLLENLLGIEGAIFLSLRKKEYIFKEEHLLFLDTFGYEIGNYKELTKILGKDSVSNLTNGLNISSIESYLQDLYILLSTKSNIEISETGSELKVSNTASNIAQPTVTKSGTGRGGSRGGQF